MKKLLTVLGLIVLTNSVYAINPESTIGKAMVNKGVASCIADMIRKDVWTVGYANEFCECSMTKFISQMTLEELEKYGNNDPEMEIKADKMLDKATEECMEKLSK